MMEEEMPGMDARNNRFEIHKVTLLAAALGIAIGAICERGLATTAAPTEHSGLEVTSAGAISSQSMAAQIGLTGYKLQLREITIAPGGQIAKHDHKTRPGVVKVIRGTWTQGRPDGESDHASSDGQGILEDESMVHWFWNRGSEPATAMVCDIVPEN